MDPDRLKTIIARLADSKPHLASLLPLTTTKLTDAHPAKDADFINEAFELLTFADFNAVALEEAQPETAFGFAQHDARFLRSLRDQTLGVGQQAKPLTKAQLANARSIMMREPYLTQLALMLWPIPY